METLTPIEEYRIARFWGQYDATLYGLRQHTTPAPWRDLSDVSTLEWFHHAMRSGGPVLAFSLNLSPDIEALTRNHPSGATWLSARITRRLHDAFGRKVDFWFAMEVSDKRHLHLHGELQMGAEEAKIARKSLRLAGGEWEEARQHQCRTAPEPSVVWAAYSAKASTFMRQRVGTFHSLFRPIAGDWIFATNNLRRRAKHLYTDRREQVLTLMRTLPADQ